MDTAASEHFVTTAFSTNTRPASNVSISQPDGSPLYSDSVTNLQLTTHPLPPLATEANIIPNLSDPLVSIGQLCNHDCVAVFRKRP